VERPAHLGSVVVVAAGYWTERCGGGVSLRIASNRHERAWTVRANTASFKSCPQLSLIPQAPFVPQMGQQWHPALRQLTPRPVLPWRSFPSLSCVFDIYAVVSHEQWHKNQASCKYSYTETTVQDQRISLFCGFALLVLTLTSWWNVANGQRLPRAAHAIHPKIR
jgi:hypothetical protein